MTGYKKVFILLIVVLAVMAGATAMLLALSTNMGAGIVVGHEFLAQTGTNEADADEDTLNQPFYAYATASKLFIADTTNNRVLIYNSIPTTDDAPADVVVGQVDMQSVGSGLTDSTLNAPRSVFYDGTRLFIGDYGNRRVLIYNTLPTINGTAADVVVGQADMTSNAAACTPAGSSNVYGVFSDGSKLFVADWTYHRVMIYDPIPTINGTAASVVVGQPNQTTCTFANSNVKLRNPTGVFSDGANLYISEQSNNRVVIYNTIPAADGAAADVVVGQTGFGLSLANAPSRSLGMSAPRSVSVDGTKMFVADYNNHRVLIFNTIPTVNGTGADVVVGQPDLTAGTANNGGIGPNTLSGPTSAFSDGTKLYISEYLNNRVLIFNSIPVINDESADLVLGQVDFVSSYANQSNGSVPSAYSLNTVYNVNTDGTKMYIADPGNHRVLIYNSIPETSHPAASVVIGQPDMVSATANNGGISAATLQVPDAVFATNSKMFVADSNNNRVLIFNSIPVADGTAADVVVGQPNMTSLIANNGGISVGMWRPYGVYATATTLLVADGSNNRVLIYNSIPAVDGTGADVVLGQPDMLSNTFNNGGLSASTLYQPWDVMTVSGKVFVADTLNNRVLIYNSIPFVNGTAADVVVGQPNMGSNTANNGGIGANTLFQPKGVYSDGTLLFICDQGNHRILVFNTIPVADNASADMVIGQADFTSNTANQGMSASAYTLQNPVRAFYTNGQLFVGDSANFRALIYQPYVERGLIIKMW